MRLHICWLGLSLVLAATGGHADGTEGLLLPGAAALDAADLGEMRARGNAPFQINELDMQIGKVDANASMDHNVVYSGVTGSNSVAGNAFQGASGIATIIQNSGNNVIIQNATIVNFALQRQ